MSLERLWDILVVEIGKYTALPAIIAFLFKIPGYDERIVFVILIILNWIFLLEFRIRDIRRDLRNLSKKSRGRIKNE